MEALGELFFLFFVALSGLIVGLTGLGLCIAGLAKHRAVLWATGLGLLAPVLLVTLVVGGGMFIHARTEQARTEAARADIAALRVALDRFKVDVGRYPIGQEGLRVLVEAPDYLPSWHGPYLGKGVPRDPWGRRYIYRCPAQHNPEGYDLLSFGSDGREDGGDDVDNWSGK